MNRDARTILIILVLAWLGCVAARVR